MNNDLIQVMEFNGYGTCPRCGNNMILVEAEMSYTVINNNVVPISNSQEYYRCELICKPCQLSFPMKRIGMSYVPDSKFIKDIIDYKNKKRIEK